MQLLKINKTLIFPNPFSQFFSDPYLEDHLSYALNDKGNAMNDCPD